LFAKAWHVLGTAARGWWNDRAMSMGAAIALYTLFSLAPVLLVCVAVAGLMFGRGAAQGAIVAELGGLIGSAAAKDVQGKIISASNTGTGIVGTALGAVTFLLLATGVFVELQDDLNVVWKARPPATYNAWTFIRSRILSIALIVAIGAAMTALLFSIGKFLIGFDLGRTDVASSYGVAASIMTVLLWIYYSWQIVLFGAEFTKAFAEKYGSRSNAP
jgi:membrane protein